MRYWILLLLFPLVIQCQNVSSWGKLRLDETVIQPYRTAFNLLHKDIVEKLSNVNDSSLSDLAHALHCTTEEILINLKRATIANDDFIQQINVDIDQLSDSISKLENEIRQTETTMHELSTTVDNAREQAQLAQEVFDQKDKWLKGLMKFEMEQSIATCGRSQRNRMFGMLTHRETDSMSRRNGVRCSLPWMHHVHAYRNAPDYLSSVAKRDAAAANLTERTKQLDKENEKYVSVQRQSINSQTQLVELNRALQQQRKTDTVASILNKHLKSIGNHLKLMAKSSKRLLNVVKKLLNFGGIIQPLNAVYQTLVYEELIAPPRLEISQSTIEKINQKLDVLAKKCPQLRHRQKQFRQPCPPTLQKPVVVHTDMITNQIGLDPSSNETNSQ